VNPTADDGLKTWASEDWVIAVRTFLERLADKSAGTKGVAYATPSLVRNGHYDPELDMVTALVHGTKKQPYRVEITRVKKSLRAYCSCPVGFECKHTYAVALLIASELSQTKLPAGRKLAELLPAGWGDDEERETGAFLAPPDFILQSKEEAEAVAAEPVTVVSNGVPWWRKLFQAKKPRQIEKLLLEGMQERVVDRGGGTTWMTTMLARELSAVDHPLQLLQQFDESLERSARIYRYRLNPRNPELQEFLKSDEAQNLERASELKQAEDKFVEWLQTATAPARPLSSPNSLKVAWDTRPGEAGIHRLVYQVVVNHGSNRGALPRKPSSLWQFANEVANGTRSYGPAADKLLKWIAHQPEVEHSRYGSGWRGEEEDGTLMGVRDVYTWIANSSFNELVAWRDAGPISIAQHAATLSLGRSADGKPEWKVVLPTNNGHNDEVPLTECLLVAESDASGLRKDGRVFIREGATLRPLDAGAMPLEVLAAVRALPSFPAERVRKEGVGARLMHSIRSRRGGPAASEWLHEVPSKPVVELRLSSENKLYVTTLAKADDGELFDFDFNGAWLPRSAQAAGKEQEELEAMAGETPADEEASEEKGKPAKKADDVLATVPRRADVEPLEHWLALFVPSDAGHTHEPEPTVQWQVNPKQLVPLLQAWQQRPSRVEYRGNPAFRQLATLRRAPRVKVHVEKSEMDWLKVSVKLEGEMEQLSLAEVEAALQASSESLVLLTGGRAYDREELERYLEQSQLLDSLGLAPGVDNQRVHALHVAGVGSEQLESLGAGAAELQKLAAEARQLLEGFSGIAEAPVAENTAAFLRPYQRSGADFLVWAAKTFGGAVLADDMGLGKTLQVIAALTGVQAEQSAQQIATGKRAKKAEAAETLPCLVVCPASVAHNWQREAAKFAPHLKVLVLESGAARKDHLKNLGDYDVVIINYALLRRDAEALKAQDWLVIAADEAQAIKNPQAEVTGLIKQLPAKYRFALTGTPIENRLGDLWSIAEFALPGYLGPLDKMLAATGDPAASIRAHRLLRGKLRPVLMRRLKSEVAPELPERIETLIECEMSPAQKKLYLAELKKTRSLLTNVGGAEVKGQGRIQMLAALTRLRQICCDPVLVSSDAASGKTAELVELVTNLMQGGHKVLLFSQFVRMLNHLEAELKAREIRTYILTGATNKRQELVDRFENDDKPAAFLISLKAGGTGLNLTSASHVVLFDPWWNPAVEAQAIDRAHRIGQDKTVVAYRLIANGTIEERIVELQEKKRSLVRNVLEEDAFNRTLQRADFEYLLQE